VDLLRVVNRENSEDRVIVRVRLVAHRDPRASRTLVGDGTVFAIRNVQLDERWTLSHSDGGWYLVSVTGDPLSGPVLTAPLIISPAGDEQRLSEQSLIGLANRPPDGVSPAELIGSAASPSLALLDLSLADERFSPQLIASSLAHIAEVWEEASDSGEELLGAVATDTGARLLLYPGSGARRRYVKDATLVRWNVVRLDLDRETPRIDVAIVISAAVYHSTASATYGDDRSPRELTQAWTLELHPRTATEWLLDDVRDIAATP
jgi:hypothetical protein